MTPKLLKLRAEDSEDIQIISAMLQDSIVPVCDIAFQPDDKSFVMVAQRLRREAGADSERICCAVTVTGVTAAQTRGIDMDKGDRMLNLLAILCDAAQLRLVFAGDAHIRLDLAPWTVLAEDFGEPWPALCNPQH